MPTTLVSWNLKGSGNPDTAAIAAHLRAEGADVVALQEVQWHQARRIARTLGARSVDWGFKHWPLRTWPEGMAIIGVTVEARGMTRALSHGWKLWSWRRRILQVARIAPPTSPDWTLVNVHLTPHGQIGLRAVETATVLEVVAASTEPVVVAGDFNERPDGAVHRQLATAGLRDGWSVRLAPESGRRPRGGAAPAPPRSVADELARLDARHHRAADAAARLRLRHRRCSHARSPHTATRRPRALRGHLRPPAGHGRVRRGVTLSCPRLASATRAWA